jgi:hypothetical protein
LVGTQEGNKHVGVADIILKWIVKKLEVIVWTGLNWPTLVQGTPFDCLNEYWCQEEVFSVDLRGHFKNVSLLY